MKKFREAALLFVIQVVLYAIFCINFRAVAQANYHQAAMSDFAISSLNFFVIRKISRAEDSMHQWLGYALGSVCGSYLGIYLSTALLGT